MNAADRRGGGVYLFALITTEKQFLLFHHRDRSPSSLRRTSTKTARTRGPGGQRRHGPTLPNHNKSSTFCYPAGLHSVLKSAALMKVSAVAIIVALTVTLDLEMSASSALPVVKKGTQTTDPEIGVNTDYKETTATTTGWCKRKGPCLKIPASSAYRQCGLPMRSISANNGKSNLNSPNLAPFLLLNPVPTTDATPPTATTGGLELSQPRDAAVWRSWLWDLFKGEGKQPNPAPILPEVPNKRISAPHRWG